MWIVNIQIDEPVDDLHRRVLVFGMIGSCLVLNKDSDQQRQTKRHGWKVTREWLRLNRRERTMPRRDVPQHTIDKALAKVREMISYDDTVGRDRSDSLL